MTILENFKFLQEIEDFDVILCKLGLSLETTTPEELEKFYFENIENIYKILPFETFKFLKSYFENEETIPEYLNEHNYAIAFNCIAALKKLGIATFSEDEIEYHKVLTKIKKMRKQECNIRCICDSEEDTFFHTKLDSRFTKSLFKYLNENQSVIDEEIVLRETISGLLKAHLAFFFDDLVSNLNKLGFKMNKVDVSIFLEHKMDKTIYFTCSLGEELVIVDTTLINSDQFIETLLSLKDFTKLHSVDTYRNLSFHFNDPVEILNIEKRLKKLNLKSDRIFAIMPYLQSFILNYSSFDNLLETIEKRLEIPVTSDSIIKQNLALLLNRLPNALEGGRINSQRVAF